MSGEKREREGDAAPAAEAAAAAEDDAPVGPPRPPPGGAPDSDDEAPMPGPPKPKKKRVLEHEHVYLDALPCAEMYEKSFMHRDVITHVLATRTDFFVTGSVDGHLKFWKRKPEGVEFVKHYRAHAGPLASAAVSHDGEHLASCGASDRSAKIYDVASFDMMGMLKLGFAPGPCEWVSARGDAVLKLAIADAASPAIHVFDAQAAAAAGGAGPAAALACVRGGHGAPVRCLAFSAAARAVLSSDAKGVLEVWCPESYGFAAHAVSFRFKAETDLYAHAVAKTAPFALAVSPDGGQFATLSPDRRVRVFRFATGKLRCVLDESLEAAGEAQRSGPAAFRLEDIDFGRRMAIERELDREWAAGGAPPPSLSFDESGHFLLYPTYLGVKVVNLVTARCARVLGRVENNERFLQLALAQGRPARDRRGRAAPVEAEARARVAGDGNAADPVLAAAAFRKHRVYFFTRREPAEAEDAASGRDVFNERPLADDVAAAAALAAGGGGGGGALPRGATIHTTLGDIGVRLYGEECPRTVENWATHVRNGYYDSLIFHRVIKGFMLQTGDPLGDGTGGLSIWGGEFEDEIRRDLRHDRPFTLSMANAGPNTNGSQFFITTVATPWLDGKHTVFGRVTRGADVVQAIERAKTDKNDKPLTDIKMISISLDLA